jgi:hypothetical protein
MENVTDCSVTFAGGSFGNELYFIASVKLARIHIASGTSDISSSGRTAVNKIKTLTMKEHYIAICYDCHLESNHPYSVSYDL